MEAEFGYSEQTLFPDGSIARIINSLFDMPLYGWYVVVIDAFAPGDIEGTLMTPPFEFHGPLDELTEARKLIDDLQSGHKAVD